MTYIGGVSGDSNSEVTNKLPTTAAIGDTYVVSVAFGGYQPGDLLIATAKEGAVEDADTGKLPAAGLEWTHVKTGYDASLEQSVTTVDGKIQLTSAVGANNGQVEFVSDGSAATVNVANNKVTIGMEWEDFPAEA
jgi:hypothetical protein